MLDIIQCPSNNRTIDSVELAKHMFLEMVAPFVLAHVKEEGEKGILPIAVTAGIS